MQVLLNEEKKYTWSGCTQCYVNHFFTCIIYMWYIFEQGWQWSSFFFLLSLSSLIPWIVVCVLVLVLVEAELNSFVVACTGLCFGFVVKIMLIIHWCFSYCWAVLRVCVISASHTTPSAGGAQNIERKCSNDSWPQLTKETSCSAIKFGGRLARRSVLKDWLGIGHLIVNSSFYWHQLSCGLFSSLFVSIFFLFYLPF